MFIAHCSQPHSFSPDMVLRSTLHSTLSKSLAQYIPVDLLPLHSQSAKVLYQCGSQSEAIEALSAAVLYRQRNPNTLRNSEFSLDNKLVFFRFFSTIDVVKLLNSFWLNAVE